MNELYGSDAYAPARGGAARGNRGRGQGAHGDAAAADAGRAGRRVHRPGLDAVRDRQGRRRRWASRPAQIGRRPGVLARACCWWWWPAPSCSPATTCWPWPGPTAGSPRREVLRNWVLVCAANFAGAAGLALLVVRERPHRHERRRRRPRGGADRAGQAGPALVGGLLSRRAVQRAGLHGGVDGHGRPQRGGQGGGRRLPDHAPSSPPASSTASPTCT